MGVIEHRWYRNIATDGDGRARNVILIIRDSLGYVATEQSAHSF